jgi:hypothetical protein
MPNPLRRNPPQYPEQPRHPQAQQPPAQQPPAAQQSPPPPPGQPPTQQPPQQQPPVQQPPPQYPPAEQQPASQPPQQPPPGGPPSPEGKPLQQRPLTVVLAVVAIAGVIALIVWAAGGGSSTESSTSPGQAITQIGPQGFSASALPSFVAGTLKQPVYWAGPRGGDIYELTRTTTGNVYVRYLPPGVAVGKPGANFLIVATYPFPNALSRLKAIANGKGTTLSNGAFALPDATYPKSVHMAFPGASYQIEVYDPSPAVARRVALSGAIGLVR